VKRAPGGKSSSTPVTAMIAKPKRVTRSSTSRSGRLDARPGGPPRARRATIGTAPTSPMPATATITCAAMATMKAVIGRPRRA
jgi:hypothetical protein